MKVDHKVILIDNLTFLKKNITTLAEPILLDTLLQLDVLDEQEVDDVRSKVTDHGRTDQLLQYILRSSYEQYLQFLEALNESNHQHVYIKLGGNCYFTLTIQITNNDFCLVFFLAVSKQPQYSH